jgi:hypothetical protein
MNGLELELRSSLSEEIPGTVASLPLTWALEVQETPANWNDLLPSLRSANHFSISALINRFVIRIATF